MLTEGWERVGGEDSKGEDSRGGETSVSLPGREAVRWAQAMRGWPRASGKATC